MDENEYNARCEEAFAAAEQLAEDTDMDFDRAGDTLEIEMESGGKVIISRQRPTRELWLAAKSGGYHYRHQDGAWRNTRDGGEFLAQLRGILEE